MPVSVVWWLARSGGLPNPGQVRTLSRRPSPIPSWSTCCSVCGDRARQLVYLLPKIASDKKWAYEAFASNDLIWRNIPPSEQHSRWAYEAFVANDLMAVCLTLRTIISPKRAPAEACKLRWFNVPIPDSGLPWRYSFAPLARAFRRGGHKCTSSSS